MQLCHWGLCGSFWDIYSSLNAKVAEQHRQKLKRAKFLHFLGSRLLVLSTFQPPFESAEESLPITDFAFAAFHNATRFQLKLLTLYTTYFFYNISLSIQRPLDESCISSSHNWQIYFTCGANIVPITQSGIRLIFLRIGKKGWGVGCTIKGAVTTGQQCSCNLSTLS